MINWFRDKLGRIWYWSKKQVRWVLVGTITAATALGLMLASAPIPQHEILKTDKANIVSSWQIGDVTHYGYKIGQLEEDFKLDPQFSNFEGVELKEKRTSNGRWIKRYEVIDGVRHKILTQGIFASFLPMYHKEDDETWQRLKYSTTTNESFDRQTLSRFGFLVARAASFLAAGGNAGDDGYFVSSETANQSWASKHDPASSVEVFNDSTTQAPAWIRSGSGSNEWNFIRRGILPFDTSTSTLTVVSSTIVITSAGAVQDIMDQSVHIASTTNKGLALVLADYDYTKMGTTSFAEVDVTNFGGDGAKNLFLLATSGRAHLDGQISRSTSTTFTFRLTMDLNDAPVWPGGTNNASVNISFSEDGATDAPILYIEFSPVVIKRIISIQ